MLRLFFDSPFVGMAVTSPRSKRWVKFNDELCRILGYPRDELERLTWTEITHPDDVPADLDQFHRVIAGETDGYRMDKRFIRPDGTVVHAAIDVRCVRDGEGVVDFFLATIRDITEGRAAPPPTCSSPINAGSCWSTHLPPRSSTWISPGACSPYGTRQPSGCSVCRSAGSSARH